jgi:hypothetical protein
MRIPDVVKFAGEEDFDRDISLKEICGFCVCTSLRPIEIPSSIEVIGHHGFFESATRNEIIFSSNSCLRETDGFGNCRSLMGCLGRRSLNEMFVHQTVICKRYMGFNNFHQDF